MQNMTLRTKSIFDFRLQTRGPVKDSLVQGTGHISHLLQVEYQGVKILEHFFDATLIFTTIYG